MSNNTDKTLLYNFILYRRVGQYNGLRWRWFGITVVGRVNRQVIRADGKGYRRRWRRDVCLRRGELTFLPHHPPPNTIRSRWLFGRFWQGEWSEGEKVIYTLSLRLWVHISHAPPTFEFSTHVPPPNAMRENFVAAADDDDDVPSRRDIPIAHLPTAILYNIQSYPLPWV